MVKCSVPGCHNNNGGFRFPKLDPEAFLIWKLRIQNPFMKNMTDEQINKKYRVCKAHFSQFCFRIDNRCLIPRSLPTLNVPGFDGEPTFENSVLPSDSKNVRICAGNEVKIQCDEPGLTFDEVIKTQPNVETIDNKARESNLWNEFIIEEKYIDFIDNEVSYHNENIRDYDTLLSDYEDVKNELESLQKAYKKAENDMISVVKFMSIKDVTNTNFKCTKCNFSCTSTRFLRDHILEHIEMNDEI